MTTTTPNVNLEQRAPRSPRVRLGGFAHLPRLIDKAQASLADHAGEYLYGGDSLLDQEFFRLTGITPEAFLRHVATGKGDWEILEWVLANASPPLLPHEIQAWSQWIETLPGLSPEARSWFAEFSQSLNPPRPDVGTLFEYLDLDDYVHFGGRP